jgi:hypothetical protein
MDNTKQSTSDTNEALEFAGRPPVKVWPLRFDTALTLSINVYRHPMSNGRWWTRVQSAYYQIAFGDDITNGKGKVTFRWENRFNGDCPPTLSESGSAPTVQWIDESIREEMRLENPEFARYCPVSNPDGYMKSVSSVHPDLFGAPPDWSFIWADPTTGRLRNSDLHFLIEEKDVSVIECNSYCPCKQQCPCCFSKKGSCATLALFFDPQKGWGVVATDTIEAGQLIAIYAGNFTRDKGMSGSKARYYFAIEFGDLANDAGYDARKYCNIARFINNSHKDESEKFEQPNARTLNIISTICELAILGIFARRRIFRGEEVCIYYGEHYGLDQCACNACLRGRD